MADSKKIFPTEVNPYELCARITSLEEKLLSGLEVINNNQNQMGEDVAKIKEAVYNPDVGLYARLRIVEEEKKRASKLGWLVLSVFVGTFGAYVVNLILTH
tara:strand:+ start:164 stop:466 length:303 start_codon:yes stop_codon:yes gene_type:complete